MQTMQKIKTSMTNAALAIPWVAALLPTSVQAQNVHSYDHVSVVRLDYSVKDMKIYTEDPKNNTTHVTSMSWWIDSDIGDNYLPLLLTAYSKDLPVNIKDSAYSGLAEIELTTGN
ncbi:hypothetical protein [Dyella flagellata]|uniref:Uncharacterized protein n=1 Tax=Dyella flagellata TaxID=1867833 RepID=A0ABQ5XBQ3_9GAMM|nr:hypothetical protein [Dyella flagellata]GLQ87960.1 hypothetical protein GCM10007898_15280 [Dyella flagellata]